MTVWFTADLHLGHSNIIEYSSRPFADAAEMDATLIRRWNELVEPGDDVWVLGDFAMGKIRDTLPRAAQLRGTKHLLTGNHDRCWDGHGARAQEWAERYVEAGFDEIHHGTIELAIGDTDVLACHFPYEGDSHDYDRYIERRPVDRGQWLLHGHVHERWQQRGRMINVGVDVWDYRPVSEAQLSQLIAG